MNLSTRLAVACPAVMSCAVFAQATFQGLGTLSGTTGSNATAVSDDGTVVVGHADGGPGVQRAWRWTAAHGMVDLGVLPGMTMAGADAVNADGSVVVGGCDNGSTSAAFRWTASGMISIGFSTATAVSADGSVVVGDLYSGGAWHAFRWTRGGGVGPLGVLPGQTSSRALSVSADGSVVVGYSGPGSGSAFRWTSASGIASLGIFPGGTHSYGYGVSPGGSVAVGWSAMSTGPGHAFRWMPDGGLQDLGVPAGGNYSAALSASSNGTIVGSAFFLDSGFGGFIWSPVLGMVRIETFLQSRGVDLTGWHLSVAAITPDARTIVGGGTHNGQSEAWIATIQMCGSADFNNDGSTGTDSDIEAFFACLAGMCCPTCGFADFNGDGQTGTDADIEAFFSVLAGGNC